MGFTQTPGENFSGPYAPPDMPSTPPKSLAWPHSFLRYPHLDAYFDGKTFTDTTQILLITFFRTKIGSELAVLENGKEKISSLHHTIFSSGPRLRRTCPSLDLKMQLRWYVPYLTRHIVFLCDFLVFGRKMLTSYFSDFLAIFSHSSIQLPYPLPTQQMELQTNVEVPVESVD